VEVTVEPAELVVVTTVPPVAELAFELTELDLELKLLSAELLREDTLEETEEADEPVKVAAEEATEERDEDTDEESEAMDEARLLRELETDDATEEPLDAAELPLLVAEERALLAWDEREERTEDWPITVEARAKTATFLNCIFAVLIC